MNRVREEFGRGARRLLRSGIPIVQCAVAAALAWWVAASVIGHASPFFAPISAVICLGASLDQRMRRVVELVAGVSVGILIGDLLISAIGSGPWQLALVVGLAMSVAVFLDGGAMIARQAASSAVLVTVLLPPGGTGGLDRFVDALVGGLIALAVAALLPANPLSVAHQKGRVVLGELADALRGLAVAVSTGDPRRAATVLTRTRESQHAVDQFQEALQAGREIARIAPLRWRRRRDLDRYVTASSRVDLALRNTRVLARRAHAALRDGEEVARALPALLERLAGAVVLLRDELSSGREPVQARAAASAVAKAANAELLESGGFSMRVVVAQLRSVAVDLLQATGMSRDDAVAVLPPLHRGRRAPEETGERRADDAERSSRSAASGPADRHPRDDQDAPGAGERGGGAGPPGG
ncbi:hypothetical protein C1701_11935 [Actinoalloteichus sp. AHMU CJ021]|uniref:FUSC family protein n=1 Tax=Actinoalloteichus sp. AHMU CJ021 TaxID=2072503 RepID=UPI000CA04DA4|nr:hypothetical protein C1701_11935 [Actinoalloteichus sp. AHMU CJ021]